MLRGGAGWREALVQVCLTRQMGALSRRARQKKPEAADEKKGAPKALVQNRRREGAYTKEAPKGDSALDSAVSLFAFGCVGPPGLRRCAAHEVHSGHEGVEHTRVLASAAHVAQLEV